jgi:DNA-binding PadR family transcriptional regulator
LSLTYAILSIIDLMPMTGYDLKHQAFDETANYFWPADQSQIYRTLKKLADDGYAELEVDRSTRPHRKVYHITEAGRTHLDEWIRQHDDPPVLRDPFLIRLFFAWHVPNAHLLQLIADQRKAHEERLASYQAIDIPPPEEALDARWSQLQQLTLDFGIRLEEEYLDWLDHCRDVIHDLPEADPDRRSPFERMHDDPPSED